MILRLASLLVLAAALASCREPMSDQGDRGPLGELAERGGRAISTVSGRDDPYYDESVSPYERGVRDGLRDAAFDREERSAAYRRGYDAGRRELQRDRQRFQASERGYDERPAPRRAPDRRSADYVSRDNAARDYASAEYGSSDYRAEDYRRVGASFGGSRQAPQAGMSACADETEAMFGLPNGSAAAVSARPRDNGGFDVSVRANGRRVLCRLNADGEVRSVDEQ